MKRVVRLILESTYTNPPIKSIDKDIRTKTGMQPKKAEWKARYDIFD